jgi:RHS repeat-associated protein
VLFFAAAIGTVVFESYAHADKPEGLSAQTLKLPDGPASMKGLGESFSPNIATGTGSYSIPITLPTATLSPVVSVSYSTGKGKGEAGLGFRIPVLNIYRTTDKGLPKFTGSDRFAVEGPTLNDELVPVDAEHSVFRLKNEGAYALFTRSKKDDSWTVDLKTGEKIVLGATTQARQGNSQGTYRWFIEKHSDRFGHAIEYFYKADSRHLYIERIEYQQNRAAAFRNKVSFEWESRPDTYINFSYGEKEVTNLRLKTIKIAQGDRQIRSYRFTYENAQLLSLLKSVSMEGEGGSAMPPVTFGYVPFSSASGQFITMVQPPPPEGIITGDARFEDVNGDALPDILAGATQNYRYYENIDGLKWEQNAKPLLNSPDRNLSDPGVIVADVDGDGFRDVVFPHDGKFRYYPGGWILNGLMLGYREYQTLTPDAVYGFDWTSADVKLSDLNHDGRTDLLYQGPGEPTQILNLPSGSMQTVSLPALPSGIDFHDPDQHFIDFNGDGILDFVKKEITRDSGRLRVWYGTGWGRYTPEVTVYLGFNGDGSEYYLQDVNRDGQVDLVRISGSWVGYYLNKGDESFTTLQGSTYGMPPAYETQKVMFADMNGNGTTDIVWLTNDNKIKFLELTDQPNAGLLSRIDNGMGQVTTIKYRSSTEYNIEAKKAGTPWKTTLPISVSVISEITTTDSFDKLGLTANVTTTKYSYRDGYYDGKEREFRGFGQVTTTNVGDDHQETKISKTWMHVGRNLSTGEDEEILKGKPYMQTVEDESGNIYSSVETQWERRWLCQDDLGTSQKLLPDCTRYSNKDEAKDNLVAVAVQTAALSGSWEKTQAPRYSYQHSEFDIWGNETKKENDGEVTFTGTRKIGDVIDPAKMNVASGSDELIEEKTYINDAANWLLGFVSEAKVKSLDGSVVAHSRMYYDGEAYKGLALGSADTGKLMRQEAWLKSPGSAERWINEKRSAYNGDGQLVGTMDANGNLRELGYDAETGNFVTSEKVTVESGVLTYGATYDAAYGAVTSATDFNGNRSQFFYDGLGRLTTVVDPLGSLAQPLTRYSYQFGTTDNPISTTVSESLVDRKTGAYRKSWTYTDGLGRKRLVKVKAEEPYKYIASGWTDFSSQGTVTHAYKNFSSSTSLFEGVPSFTFYTESYFDLAGRAVKIFPPQTGLVSTYTITQYLPFETRVYDERDTSEGTWLYPATTLTDGLGRVRQIIKHNDVDGAFATLTWDVGYDTVGNITSITDPKSNKRSYQYDTLKHLASLTDPNAGIVGYAYDDVGNQTLRRDALEQEIYTEYGLANRVKSVTARKNAYGQADYTYKYHYDQATETCTNGTNLKGQVVGVESTVDNTCWSYDEFGRVKSELRNLWDATSDFANQTRRDYEQSYEYNAAGEITTEHRPGGFDLGYQYNERGLLISVSDGSTSYLKGATYDISGSELRHDLGNGTSGCRWFDARQRLIGIKAAPTSTDVCAKPDVSTPGAFLHQTYQINSSGMIGSVKDMSEAKAEISRLDATYDYDRLYQLIKAINSSGSATYKYDTIQNLTGISSGMTGQISGVWKYAENGAGPNHLTSISAETFQYNKIGNLLAYNGHQLDFDVEGRLVSASKPTGTRNDYYYDAFGERRIRVSKSDGDSGKITQYVFSGYQIRDGKDTWYVSAGKEKLVEISNGSDVELSLYLLDGLVAYANDPQKYPKPLPSEQLDLDNDGSKSLTNSDIQTAIKGYWNENPIPNSKKIVRYFHSDQLGGPTSVTDSTGDPVSFTAYLPYGTVRSERGERPRYGYAGGEREPDSDLGLIQYGARWYAPKLGRWVSADPLYLQNPEKGIGQVLQLNLYSYALNNPMMFLDPSGQDVWDQLMGAAWGTLETIAGPVGSNIQAPAGNADFNAGRASGQIATGTVMAITGGGMIAAGGGVTVGTGGAALLTGAPALAIAGGAALAGFGADAVQKGLNSFSKATKESGGGASGASGGGETAAAKAGPSEPYNRAKHYGKTPTAADRKVVGAGPGQVADHDPPLVKRYYEGDIATGEKPGWQMTPQERAASASDRSRMAPQSQADSNAQGGKMRAYSIEQKKANGL